MNTRLFIGLDGGASKTAGILMTHEGKCLASFTGPRCVFHGKPSDDALNVIDHGVHALLTQAGAARSELERIGLGVNGVDLTPDWERQHAAIAQALHWNRKHLHLVNDGVIALWAGCSDQSAAILQHGSGFTSAYRSDWGKEVPFDHLNMGKIFDIRRQLYVRIARMIDGRSTVTPLRDRVLNHFKVHADAFHEMVFRNDRSPTLSMESMSLLESGWQANDAAAIELFDLAINDYACTAHAMLTHISSKHSNESKESKNATVVVGGGLLTRFPPTALQQLTTRIRATHTHASVRLPEFPPAHGAALMAAFHSGLDMNMLFKALQTERLHSADL